MIIHEGRKCLQVNFQSPGSNQNNQLTNPGEHWEGRLVGRFKTATSTSYAPTKMPLALDGFIIHYFKNCKTSSAHVPFVAANYCTPSPSAPTSPTRPPCLPQGTDYGETGRYHAGWNGAVHRQRKPAPRGRRGKAPSLSSRHGQGAAKHAAQPVKSRSQVKDFPLVVIGYKYSP